MIRIEQFLFETNVEQTQAEYLISEYPDLMFNTMEEFQDFFNENKIRLNKNSTTRARQDAFPEKQELLQRFKEFKSSTDYDYVRQYIIEQRKIQDAINAGNVEFASNFLDSIVSRPVDPFFNFVVRKILTGSETGVLPSERLKSLLDDLIESKKPEIDIEPDVVRDEINRVKSFDNYLKNKGSLKVEVLDERFTLDVFDYTVDRSFRQIDDAINAEENILKRAAEFSTIPVDGGDLEQVLTDGLKQLVLSDSNSVPALQQQIKDLETVATNLSEIIAAQKEQSNASARIIAELNDQYFQEVSQNSIKDETIDNLNLIIDTTISELQTNVSSQLTNTSDAFDALAAQLESQAQKAEENAAKQLESFEKAITGVTEGLTEALKPKEPEPDEDNPAGDIIKQIITEWDKIYVVSDTSYSTLSKILDQLGVKKKPIKSEYVYSGPNSLSNSYSATEEAQQHIKWNESYKDQFKSLLIDISDEKIAKEILSNVKTKLVGATENGKSDKNGMYQTLLDVLVAWATDFRSRRGTELRFVRDIASEIGLGWPPFSLNRSGAFENLNEGEALRVLGVNKSGQFSGDNNSVFGKIRSGGYDQDIMFRCVQISGKMLL